MPGPFELSENLKVTHDVSDITSARFLNGIGKKSALMARISTAGPERGSADTASELQTGFQTSNGYMA